MKSEQKEKIQELIKKYNPILKESIEIALVEDLFNLVIVNKDDADFELSDLLKEKEQLKSFVMQEFIRLNNKPITSELKDMEEINFIKKKPKQGRLNL